MATQTLNPTSNTTPDPGQGGNAVSGASNTGHGSTTSTAVGAATTTKTCIWTTFQAASGLPIAVTLKADWTQDGSLSDGGILTSNVFTIEYSLNGGSSWSTLKTSTNVTGPSSGTASVSLSASQVISQVRVRDILQAVSDTGETSTVVGTVSLIRLECELASGAVGGMM